MLLFWNGGWAENGTIYITATRNCVAGGVSLLRTVVPGPNKIPLKM